jgi:large subunit ribosomal protein L10
LSLNLDEKKAVVTEVSKQIENAQALILAEYRGVGVGVQTWFRIRVNMVP